MKTSPAKQRPLEDIHHRIDVISRRERGRLIAQLVNRLGQHRLQLAEDVAQDAIIKALVNWPYHGMPDNPGAWLSTVASNKAIDRLRRENREQEYDLVADLRLQSLDEDLVENPYDPDIELMLLSCHPALANIDQLALTLRIVNGFTARELASVFLCTETAMGQRLARAKRKLKTEYVANDDKATSLTEEQKAAIFKTIYLMFSLGYAPRTGKQLIRKDIALEALRLAEQCCNHLQIRNADAHALCALLYFQASRLDAREQSDGKPVLLHQQNWQLWNREYIQRGFHHLQLSQGGDSLSRYHVEAAIASLYANAKSWDGIQWRQIVVLYSLLQNLTPSPVVTINASVALAMGGDPATALQTLDDLNDSTVTNTYAPFHIAKAEILTILKRPTEASDSFNRAIQCGASTPVVEHLEFRLSQLL